MELNPDYAEAHNNLGNALANRKQFDEAIAHYRKSLAIKPNFAEAHNNLGIALAARGQLDEAIAHYQKTLEIKPHYADAYNNLGELWPAVDSSTRPWSISTRRWKSSPTWQMPITTSASPGPSGKKS